MNNLKILRDKEHPTSQRPRGYLNQDRLVPKPVFLILLSFLSTFYCLPAQSVCTSGQMSRCMWNLQKKMTSPTHLEVYRLNILGTICWNENLHLCISQLEGPFKYPCLPLARIPKRHLICIHISGILKVIVSTKSILHEDQLDLLREKTQNTLRTSSKAWNWKHTFIFASHRNVSKMTAHKFKGIKHMDKENGRGDGRMQDDGKCMDQ